MQWDRPITRDSWLTAMLVAVVLTAPLELERVLDRAPGFDDTLHRVSLFLFDVPAIALAGLVALRLTRERMRSPGWLGIGVALLVLGTAVSVVVHPSWRGVQALVRLGEMIGVAAALLIALRLRPRPVVVAAAVMVVLESVLGFAQLLHAQTDGLGLLAEHGGLDTIGGLVAAKGTFTHRYLYAGFAMVVATGLLAVRSSGRDRWLMPTLFLAGMPLGLALGRVSVVGLVLSAPVILTMLRARDGRGVLLSWMGGAAFGALSTLNGWLARATYQEPGIDWLTSGRIALARQALRLFGHHPFFGVGAGRYVIAQEQVAGTTGQMTYPVHNVPLLVLAECGVVGFVGVMIILIVLTRRVLRGNSTSKLVFLGYIPFVIVDVPYALPMGTCVLAAWVGLLLYLTRPEARRDADRLASWRTSPPVAA